MTGSSVGGIFLGGAVIQAFGLEAGLWLLTAASIAGVIFHQRTPIPRHEASTARQGAIRSAAAIAFRTEPLRSLLALTTVLGIVITASTLLLPEIARRTWHAIARRKRTQRRNECRHDHNLDARGHPLAARSTWQGTRSCYR